MAPIRGSNRRRSSPRRSTRYDPSTNTTVRLTTEVARPHGLALSLDESELYIGDTDAINGKDPYDPDRSRTIHAAPLIAPDKIGPLREILSVPIGIPDGFIVTEPDGDLWVGAGDGLRRYDKDGNLKKLYPVDGTVFNVTLHDGRLYSTADTEIWQTELSRRVSVPGRRDPFVASCSNERD